MCQYLGEKRYKGLLSNTKSNGYGAWIKQCTVKLQWLEHGWLVYRGWFELVFESLGNFTIDQENKIFRDFREIFLLYDETVC